MSTAEQLRRWHQGKETGRSLGPFGDTSQVRYGGEVVPLGVAVRAVMTKRCWLHVVLLTTATECMVTDAHGGGEVVLPLVEPREG